MSEDIEFFTRKDLATFRGCCYNHACKLFNEIKATIPKKKQTADHKKALHKSLVLAFFAPQ